MYKQIISNIKKYGLKKGNKEAYVKLRSDYNSLKNPILLYLLICFGFEHQIRFNSSFEFNNPCGNSGFNDEMLEKLVSYKIRSNEIELDFNSKDYQDFFNDINCSDFVYCDPPYLSTCGAYNDGKRGFNGWDKDQQKELLRFLDKLNTRGIKFMLSNFTEHENIDNEELFDWATKNHYKIILNDKVTKRNRQDRRELIVINY